MCSLVLLGNGYFGSPAARLNYPLSLQRYGNIWGGSSSMQRICQGVHPPPPRQRDVEDRILSIEEEDELIVIEEELRIFPSSSVSIGRKHFCVSPRRKILNSSSTKMSLSYSSMLRILSSTSRWRGGGGWTPRQILCIKEEPPQILQYHCRERG